MLDNETLPLCAYCHKEPVASPNGKYCCRAHYDAARREVIPESWRQLHTWMTWFQRTSGRVPLLDEMVHVTPFTNRSGVVYALSKLQSLGLIEVIAPEKHMMRYRAVGVLPARKS